ncbi:MAG: hypothetical protein QGF59_16795, partial [Pirellulaceae bacterium]|nr:hypothetical protein [Pirellulaceae bacterium]
VLGDNVTEAGEHGAESACDRGKRITQHTAWTNRVRSGPTREPVVMLNFVDLDRGKLDTEVLVKIEHSTSR